MADSQRVRPPRKPVPGIVVGIAAGLAALWAIDRWANPPEKALEGDVPFRQRAPTPSPSPRAAEPGGGELPTTPGRASHMPGVVRRPGEGDVSVATPGQRPPGTIAAVPAQRPAAPSLPEEVRQAVAELFSRLESEKEWGGSGRADPPPPAEADPSGRSSFLRILGERDGERLSASWESAASVLAACRRAGLHSECRAAAKVCVRSGLCGSWLAKHVGIL